MLKLRLFLWMALLSCAAAYAQTMVPITGTHVIYFDGSLLPTGTVCAGSSCATVTNGAVAIGITVPNGTQTITLQDGAGNRYFSLPGVQVGNQINFDGIVVQASQTLTVQSKPYTACSIGAQAIETDTSPATKWTCAATGGRIGWVTTNGGANRASGFYGGAGAPAFTCVSPCLYIQSDAAAGAAFWAISASQGAASSNWTMQGTGPAGKDGAQGAPGAVTLAQLASGAGSAATDVYANLGMSATRNRLDSTAQAVGGLSCPGGGFTAGNPSYFRTSGFIYVADLASFSSNFQLGNTGAPQNDTTFAVYDASLATLACIANTQTGTASYSLSSYPGAFWIRVQSVVNAAPASGSVLWVGGGTAPTGAAPAYGYSYPDAAYVAALKKSIPDASLIVPQQVSAINQAIDASLPNVRNLINPASFVLGFNYSDQCANNPTYYTTANGGPYGGCVSPYESQTTDNSKGSTGLIPVIPGRSYALTVGDNNGNSDEGLIYYDASGIPIRSTKITTPYAAQTLTVPLTATANSGTGTVVPAFIRLPFVASTISSAMLVPGATYSGAYIPFAQAPSTSALRSPWNGKKAAVFGDSYTAAYGGVWQPSVSAYHNLSIVFQDARSGRPIGNDALAGEGLFECYNGDPINGTFSPSYQPHQGAFGNCAQASPLAVSGNTLAQNLALNPPNLILLPIGTNTYSTNVPGSVTDAVGAATLHGQIKLAFSAFQAIAPYARILVVEPVQVTDTTVGRSAAVAALIPILEQEATIYAVSVLKLFSESGITAGNAGTFLRDGIHLTDSAYGAIFAGSINLKLNSLAPLQ